MKLGQKLRVITVKVKGGLFAASDHEKSRDQDFTY